MGATFGLTFARQPGQDSWTVVGTGLLDPVALGALAAAAPATAGIHLEVDDSDSWSVAVYANGEVILYVDGIPLPGRNAAAHADRLTDAVRRAFGLELDRTAVRKALTAEAVFAEDAMAAFAALLGLDWPDLVQNVTADHAPGPQQTRRTAEAFDIHVHAALVGPPPPSAVEYVGHLAALVGGDGWWYASPVDGGEPIAASTDDTPGVRQIAALTAAGRIAMLTAQLTKTTITYTTSPVDVHLLAPAALAADGRPREGEATLTELMLGIAPALHDALFSETAAVHGYATTVPVPDDSGESFKIRAWPPPGHWLEYLGAELVVRCGGHARVSTALAGWTLRWHDDGGVTARLPVAAHRATDPTMSPLRMKMTELLMAVEP